MVRLRGVPSECLIMPLTDDIQGLEPGTDITELAGVTKYEKPMPANIGGDIRGRFPLVHPENRRTQFSVPYLRWSQHWSASRSMPRSRPMAAAAPSTGMTRGAVRACSRNFELKDRPDTAVWQLVRKYDLEHRSLPLALQFELVGPGIQKNRLGLKEMDLRLFSVWRIDQRRYLDFDEMLSFAQSLGLPMVELVEIGASFDLQDDEVLRRYAERTYANGATARRCCHSPFERNTGQWRAPGFKQINLLYRD